VELNTHFPSLASGILSGLDLAICSPAVSVHLMWRLLRGLCGSDHFSDLSVYRQVSCMKITIQIGL
jgi:hypothetical protein